MSKTSAHLFGTLGSTTRDLGPINVLKTYCLMMIQASSKDISDCDQLLTVVCDGPPRPCDFVCCATNL